MHSTSRPTCPSSTSLIVTTAVMTPSVLGQTQTDQSVQRASGTGSEGEGRLGPLLNQQQTQRTHPTRPPTSAVRGWPHWEVGAKSGGGCIAGAFVRRFVVVLVAHVLFLVGRSGGMGAGST